MASLVAYYLSNLSKKKILPLNIEGHIDQVFLVVKLVLHTNFIMYIN